jgi:hypothetical protein
MGRIMAVNAAGKVVSDIILAVAEAEIAPGDTARFPFAARTAYGAPSVHDFNVISDNPDFNPEWARIRPAASDGYGPRYLLEITPGSIWRLSALSLVGSSRDAPLRCRPVHAHHQAIRPRRHRTRRDHLARRSDRPAAGEPQRHRYRCVSFDNAPRLRLVEAVGFRTAGERRPVQFFRAVRSADRQAERRLRACCQRGGRAPGPPDRARQAPADFPKAHRGLAAVRRRLRQ